MIIPSGKFKKHCLKLLDEVHETQTEIKISKRGKIIAKIGSADYVPEKDIFGLLKGTVVEKSDITEPTGEKWDSENGHTIKSSEHPMFGMIVESPEDPESPVKSP